MNSRRPLLKITNLEVSYGPVRAIRDISFDIAPAEFVSIIGPNGAGKSTLLRAISGVKRAKSGEVEFGGARVENSSARAILKAGLGHCPEGRHLWADLTVQENLTLGGFIIGNKTELAIKLSSIFDTFPKLHERRDQKAGTLSGGEQQMVAIGRVLMSSPKLIMFDEPSLGLSPKMVQSTMEILEKISHSGTSILLVEQNVVVALSLSTRAIVLSQGRIVASAPSAQLIQDENLVSMYLAGEARSSVEQ